MGTPGKFSFTHDQIFGIPEDKTGNLHLKRYCTKEFSQKWNDQEVEWRVVVEVSKKEINDLDRATAYLELVSKSIRVKAQVKNKQRFWRKPAEGTKFGYCSVSGMEEAMVFLPESKKDLKFERDSEGKVQFEVVNSNSTLPYLELEIAILQVSKYVNEEMGLVSRVLPRVLGGEKVSYYDVVLVSAGGDKFHCHRSVLETLEYFRAGKKSKQMKLKTITSPVLKEIIKFAYEGVFEPELKEFDGKFFWNFFEALRMLLLTEETGILEAEVLKLLSQDTCLELMLLAHEFGLPQLKGACFPLVKQNAQEMVKMEKWAQVVAIPELVTEMVLKIV